VTLFGLTLVEKRPVQFGAQIHRWRIRFLREALVRGEIDCRADCVPQTGAYWRRRTSWKPKQAQWTGSRRNGIGEFFSRQAAGGNKYTAAFEACTAQRRLLPSGIALVAGFCADQ